MELYVSGVVDSLARLQRALAGRHVRGLKLREVCPVSPTPPLPPLPSLSPDLPSSSVQLPSSSSHCSPPPQSEDSDETRLLFPSPQPTDSDVTFIL